MMENYKVNRKLYDFSVVANINDHYHHEKPLGSTISLSRNRQTLHKASIKTM